MQALSETSTRGYGDPLWFAAAVLGLFMAANTLNFLLSSRRHVGSGCRCAMLARSFVTALPSQFATALLTAGVAFTYGHLGMGSIGLAAVILFVFLYIVRTSVQAQERGEELTQRTRELASLQMGLLSTVLQTLSMRDAMTARHSAAVARYSREVAGMLGLDEREQDLIHTAALLHDIGKFILPDSVLFANRKLTDDEWELIKLHPEQGAKLVERIEGYGPVAEIVLHHHEKYAGGGYPAGIGGEEIPLGARIIVRRGHLRRDDVARLLPAPGQLRGRAGRAAARRRHPARPEGRRGLRAHDPREAAWRSATPTRRTSSTSWRSSAA